jgi:hypothetical protein
MLATAAFLLTSLLTAAPAPAPAPHWWILGADSGTCLNADDMAQQNGPMLKSPQALKAYLDQQPSHPPVALRFFRDANNQVLEVKVGFLVRPGLAEEMLYFPSKELCMGAKAFLGDSFKNQP